MNSCCSSLSWRAPGQPFPFQEMGNSRVFLFCNLIQSRSFQIQAVPDLCYLIIQPNLGHFHLNPESPNYPRESKAFPGINEFSAGGAVPVLPKPHQNNVLEEKKLKNQEIKSHQNSIPCSNSGHGVTPSCSACPGSAPVPGKGILLEKEDPRSC